MCFISSHIINEKYAVNYLHGTAPWIGYNDMNKEGTWVWLDGGSTDPGTTAWNINEPNSSGGNEDCAHIWSTPGTKILLNDTLCKAKYHYICEIKFI